MSVCKCGCGGLAPVATKTYRRVGHLRGQPLRFINGHQAKGRKYGPPSEATRAKIRAAHTGQAAGRWTPVMREAAAERMRGRSGLANHHWKGGTHIFQNGYRGLYLPDHPRAYSNGYVYEHIVVAEQKMGRPILKTEPVHHLDHDKLNNDPDNLMVMASASEHQKFHMAQRLANVNRSTS